MKEAIIVPIYAYISAVWAGTENPFWPHLVLVPLSLAAGIAVGVGIVLERPKYSDFVHRAAFWLVVIGVAVESVCTFTLFFIDERISGAQLSKIEGLEERLAPRQLSEFGKNGRTSEIIREHAGTPFDLSVQTSREPIRFLNELEDALIAGGWVERPVRTDFQTFNRDRRPLVGVHFVSGVLINFPFNRAPSLMEAAIALANALKDEKIEASADVILVDDDPSKEDRLHIWVGEKP